VSGASELGMRLLVVEDESLIAYEVACAIEDHLDSEVVAVTTTTSALEMIAARNFDAAIVDVKLKDGTSERLAAGAASEKHTLLSVDGLPYARGTASASRSRQNA